jgi:UDP-N-acetylmuramoyl-L-alanyl-D-glutamate--2,6-diaminopimelate ligase
MKLIKLTERLGLKLLPFTLSPSTETSSFALSVTSKATSKKTSSFAPTSTALETAKETLTSKTSIITAKEESDDVKDIETGGLENNNMFKDIDIIGVSEDSRLVSPGFLFAALPGAHADGRDYVKDALKKGASAILLPERDGDRTFYTSENNNDELYRNLFSSNPVPFLSAPEMAIRGILSEAARLVYGEPEKDLLLIGITGTNGKSTASYLIESLLKDQNLRPGVMGTVNFRWEDTILPAPNTTPEGPLLYRVLKDMKKGGAKSCVMEISSHALSLGRIEGLSVDKALFTNLTRDHLDFHGDMESYFKAKVELFKSHIKETDINGKKNSPHSAINISDPWGKRLMDLLGDNAIGYGTNNSHIRPIDVSYSKTGIKLKIETYNKGEIQIDSPLVGNFNGINLISAAAMGILLDISPKDISKSLSESKGAPGRFSKVTDSNDYLALVDYAHAPGALEAVIAAAKNLLPKKLIVLFGCGGDRDKGKRPLMGKAASFGDIVVLTSDNPRTEDPLQIIAEAEQGLIEQGLTKNPSSKNHGYFVEPDRRKAIELTVDLMEKGDIALICGKGHEDYQILGLQKIHFDDTLETLKALKNAGKDK